MKNLKDYLGKKVAIACRTDAEAKFVNDFLANNGGRSLYYEWEERLLQEEIEYHNCLEFNLEIPQNCYCYEGYHITNDYDVYEASEFMEDNTSLVGRYIKALVTNPDCIGGTKIGDLFLIIFDSHENTKIKRLSDNTTNWNLVYLGVQWELMPIDFNPNELLKEFPSEGCVYDNIKNLEPLTKYLLNRPFNNPNTEINKSDAIGIGWNKTSCWWLKTKESKKTLFNLSDLKQFLPNVIQEEPFAIQLNSQEELDAIMSFYKEKGYKMFGSSDYYCKGFVVYINPKDKTWQTAHSNDRKYPFKTLSEIGIKVNTASKFIVGKWYKANLKEGIFYLKLLKQEKNKIWASEQISVKTSSFVKEPTLCFDDSVNYETDRYELLADLSEIQKYLPLGHPDKIINSPIQESDNFVLPEKWCVKLKDNYDIINKWGRDYWENITGWGNLGTSSPYMVCSFKHKICTSSHNTNGYTEITFEQFKKYVLGKSEVMEKSWTEVSLDMMQKSLTTSYPLTPDECYTSKNLLNPEIIPIKVRNLPKFETPTRVKTVIIEPELLKI